jgi:glycerol-3-phosphate O-acyltransferase / dihydroxyacetone phosphate acyltransferase
VPGFIYIAPIRFYLMKFAEKKRQEALKKSTVKIKGNDVVASWKILVGVFLCPIVVHLTSWVFFFFGADRFAQTVLGRLQVSCLFGIVLALYLLFCVQLLNGVKTHFRLIVVRAWSVLYKNRIAKIRKDRKLLKKQVKELMDKLSTLNESSLPYKRKSLVVEERQKQNLLDTEEIFGTLKEIVG